MADDPGIDWQALVDGSDPRYRRYRLLFSHLPHAPRCKMCRAPFEGLGAPLMRAIGRGRWPNNPNFCAWCETWIRGHRGGAEVEISCLFADIRGSTTLGERLGPREFSVLLNRFYDVAARVIVDADGIVDKFVGDEIVSFFIPAFVGTNHARSAVESARALVAATGHGTPDGPWIPVGAGVHTGVAFVGSIGGADTLSDFTALGDTVNTTARLASVADAGEVLVTRAAAEAAGLSIAGLETRHLELRGRTEPVDVVVLGAPVPGMSG